MIIMRLVPWEVVEAGTYWVFSPVILPSLVTTLPYSKGAELGQPYLYKWVRGERPVQGEPIRSSFLQPWE